MAYSALVSLEKTIDQILSDDRCSLSPYGTHHIISLDKYAICIRAFLEDFPEKASKNLEARVRDVATEAEDLIEWFLNEGIRHYIFRYTHWIAVLRRLKFEFQLHKMRDEMDSIAEEVVEMKNSIKINEMEPLSQVADGVAGKMKMVGLNEDLIEIKDRLSRGSRQLQILPITGMGGIGKTTLARNAYDDPLIMEHFQIRVWITISQDYSQKRIISDLLNSMKKILPESKKPVAKDSQQGNNQSVAEIPEESDIEKAVKVYQTVYGKRFLIVMDDLWSTKVLDDAKKLFPNDNNGSRILLTTRLGDVTDSSTSMSSHKMRLMDADQSWDLLREKVLEHHDCIPNEVETIGKEIASRCGGLPLAVVVVAGVLSTASMTATSWQEIARNVKSTLATTGDGQIEKILSLSYNHLPHHLRPCLLYMGGFPEDHPIKLMNLVRLWIAEGFVKPVASKSFEDSALEYVGDLIKRSLVVVVSKSMSMGEIKICSLHDLVRDMCIELSQEEKFLVHLKGGRAPELMKNVRRVSISHSDLDSFTNIISSKTRTIMYFQDKNGSGSFGSFRLLRVLDVLKVETKPASIPNQIFELFHLRYLAFWYDNDQLPKAITNLQCLQTLIIDGFYPIFLRPKQLTLPQLRHLIFLKSSHFLSSNATTFPLQHLQTLRKVRNLDCSVTNLNMFPNLKKLSLTYDWIGHHFSLQNLVHLHRLEKLKLERSEQVRRGHDVANLVPPSSLKKLVLIGWGCHNPYLNIGGPLPNLQVLKLRKYFFQNREWTTSEQDFPKLRFLLIEKCNLKQWNMESSHFPVLEHLVFHSCRSLAQVPDDIGDISTLMSIEVNRCVKSLADSAKLIQEEKVEYGDDDFQVRCIKCQPYQPREPSYRKFSYL